MIRLKGWDEHLTTAGRTIVITRAGPEIAPTLHGARMGDVSVGVDWPWAEHFFNWGKLTDSEVQGAISDCAADNVRASGGSLTTAQASRLCAPDILAVNKLNVADADRARDGVTNKALVIGALLIGALVVMEGQRR